jgi:hypothetical protein
LPKFKFSAGKKILPRGEASQSSTDLDSPATLRSMATQKAISKTIGYAYQILRDPWWELDLKATQEINRIIVWNRTDSGLQKRLNNFRVLILDDKL